MKARHWVLIITVIVLFLTFRFLLPLVLPFVLAYFFAKIVSPVVRFFTEKLNWNKKVSVVVVVVLTVFALVGFVGYTGSILIRQLISLLQRTPVYCQMLGDVTEQICCRCDSMLDLSQGTSYGYVQVQTESLYRKISTKMVPGISRCALGVFRWAGGAAAGLFIFFLSTLLILLDENFPGFHGKLRPLAVKLRAAGFAYIKAQALILFLVAAIMCGGLLLIGNDYAVLFGVGIAALDAFPLVGSGVILVPWGLIRILGGDYLGAAVLFTMFVAATFLREILEPRLFGKEIGMKPLFVLIAVYAGVKLFGVGGILLGPVALTILKVVDDACREIEA